MSEPKTPQETPQEDPQEAPKIVFPCAYPVKVIGAAVEGFSDLVVSVVQRHDPQFDPATVELKGSRNGNWQSVRLVITATGEPQLQALFDELKATGQVQMVL